MDPLSSALATHRGSGAFVLRAEMRPPWGMEVADRSAIAVVIVLSGTVTVRFPGGGPTGSAGRGEVALIRGDRSYTLAGDVGTPAAVRIDPGQLCRPLADTDPGDWSRAGDPVWGNGPGGPTVFLAGIFEFGGQLRGRLVESLPELVVLPDEQPELTTLLAAELAGSLPGQAAVLDRLVDLVLVNAVRAWHQRPGSVPPGWWSADQDPLVGRVLRMVHDDPAAPWTLELLAREVGWSRASLSRRFRSLLGIAPMAYLTRHRLELAAELLETGGLTVEQVGRRVGYANPFAFSTAFKRHHGRSPRAHRVAAAGRAEAVATGTSRDPAVVPAVLPAGVPAGC